MSPFGRICVTGVYGMLSTFAVGSAGAQVNLEQPPPVKQVKPVAPANPQVGTPGVKVHAPGVNVQTPGVNAQTPGVQVQVPGVNVQVPGVNVQAGVPGANVQVGTYNGYYSQTPWFSHPTVREQLQLNEQQYNQLNQDYRQAWNRYYQGWSKLDQNLTPAQRQQREAELRAGFQKNFSPTVTTVFADPASRQRYNQLYWQYQGYDAFQDPTLQQQLNLTAEQQQQLNQYGTAWNTQYNTWRNDYPNNRETIGQKFRESRREARQRINDTLTPAQRKTWNNLIGQPYEFDNDVYFTPAPTTNTTLKPVIK